MTSRAIDLRRWWQKPPLVRRFVPSVQKRIARWWGKRSFIVRRGGILWLMTPHLRDSTMLYSAKWEDEQRQTITTLIEKMNATMFLDIGAFAGLYSFTLAKQFPKLEIHTFEPHPYTFGVLQANWLLNEMQDRVVLHNFGVGEADGTAEIIMDGMAASLALAQERPKWSKDMPVYEVQVRPLDVLQLGKGQKIVAKIDAEGFEKEVLRGMKGLLANNDVLLQIELWDKEKAVPAIEKFGLKAIGNVEWDYYFANFSIAL